MQREPTRRYTRRGVLALIGAGGLAGCSGSEGDEPSSESEQTETTTDVTTTTPIAPTTPSGSSLFEEYDVSVSHEREGGDTSWEAPTDAPPALETELLVENLAVPWDLSFAGDGTLFITERVGRLRAFDGEQARVVAEPEDAIDAGSVDPGESHDSWWVEGGEGGTLGVTAHPNYPEPPVVYIYYTAQTGSGKRNRVVAFDVSAANPGETGTVVVDGIPAGGIHNGGRIEFGPENYLWITCGDAGQREMARHTSTFHGKVLRVTPTGDPAPGNPDLGGDADPRIFTYGHRNPQGIVWLPDGTTLVSEHGDGGQDELNRLVAGHDYGWPDVRFLKDYPAEGVHGPLASSGTGTWAPTGSVFYTGDAVPGLRNRVLISGLWSQQMTVATLTPPEGQLPPVGEGTRHDGDWSDDAYTVTTHPRLEEAMGRIRHVEQGPDGDLYAITSNRDGRAPDPYPREVDDVLVRLSEA